MSRPWFKFQNCLCLTPLIWQNFCACIIENKKNGIRRFKWLKNKIINLRMPFLSSSIMHAQKFCQMRGVKHRKFWNLNQGLDMSGLDWCSFYDGMVLCGMYHRMIELFNFQDGRCITFLSGPWVEFYIFIITFLLNCMPLCWLQWYLIMLYLVYLKCYRIH